MIAYLILVHRYPNQFKRLFRAIYHKSNHYLIHIDKRSGKELAQEIKKFLSDFPNTSMLLSKNSIWGGYSLVDAELRGIKELLKLKLKWEFFINLSAQDFPLKSQKQIQHFLSKNRGKDFLKVVDQNKFRFKTLSRIKNIVIENGNKVIRTSFKRPYLKGVTPYISNQWMILSRNFCEFLTYSPEVNKFKKFYKNTFIADEGFFPTVIMNTSYKGDIVSDDKRTIDWVPDGKIKLRPRNFTNRDAAFLINSEGLFARKFDESVNSEIFNILESHISSVPKLQIKRELNKNSNSFIERSETIQPQLEVFKTI